MYNIIEYIIYYTILIYIYIYIYNHQAPTVTSNDSGRADVALLRAPPPPAHFEIGDTSVWGENFPPERRARTDISSNQGLESSFCCRIAGQRLTQKKQNNHRHRYQKVFNASTTCHYSRRLYHIIVHCTITLHYVTLCRISRSFHPKELSERVSDARRAAVGVLVVCAVLVRQRAGFTKWGFGCKMVFAVPTAACVVLSRHGSVRFASLPLPVPAGSIIVRFGSFRPVRFGFLFLPAKPSCFQILDVIGVVNSPRPIPTHIYIYIHI